jgi:dihydroceramidase
MLIATVTVLHRVFTFDKSLSVAVASGLLSAVLMAAFITWHCITDEIIMHSALFGMHLLLLSLPSLPFQEEH